MRRLKKILLLTVPVFVGAGLLLVFFWKQGTPYQQPYWSPNGKYYVQKYSNLTLSRVPPAMPGQGSDAIDGYIRLYDTDGRLLHERFGRFIRDVKPVWAGNKVYLMGIEEMDNDPWLLPNSSE